MKLFYKNEGINRDFKGILEINLVVFTLLYFVGIVFKKLFLLELAIFIVYILLLVYSYNIKKNLSIMFLFLTSFGIFNISKIMISLFLNEKWQSGIFFKYYYFNEATSIKMLNIIFFHLISLFLGLIIYKKTFIKKEIRKIKRDKNISRVCSFLMNISFIPLFLKFKIENEFVKQHGYLSLYNGEYINHSFPIWTKGWNMLFTYSYYMYMVSIPNEKKFLCYSSIFLILKGFSAMRGGRTEFATNIFLVLTYYVIIYKKRIKKKVIMGLGLMVILLYLIGITRSGGDISRFNLTEILKNFFSEQGMSFLVLGINIENKENYLKPLYRQILAPIIDQIQRIRNPELFFVQSKKLIEVSDNINYHLSYLYIPEDFLRGAGIGSNYLAEIDNLGGIVAIIIFGIMMGYFIPKFEDNFLSTKFKMFMSIPILLNLYISPRANFLPMFFIFYPYLAVYFLFWFGMKILKKLKVKDRKNE